MLKNRVRFWSFVSVILLTTSGFSSAGAQDDETRIKALSPAAQALVLQASTLLLGGKLAEAADAFSKAIQLEPKSSFLYTNRADAFCQID